MNENKANYAKIGFFVLSGFALILIVIGIAGARVFSKQAILAETYFAESVTGLDVGSPVKYRGVPIGEVSRIGFVFSEYGNPAPEQLTLDGANQILVVMALDPDKFSPLKNHEPAAFLSRLVKDGIRVKVTASGVTGLSYLELDYAPYGQPANPFQAVTWQPKNPYIPSTPSTMVAFKKAIDDVFVKLNEINIQALGDTLLATLNLIKSKLMNVDVVALSAEASTLLAELRATNRSLQGLLAAPELQRLPADLAATAGNARRITDSIGAQLDPLTASVRSAADRADRLVGTLTGVATNAGGQVEQTVAALNQTAQTLNRTALSQQDALAELLASLRSASTGLDQLVSELRANPSALLFSRPPNPLPETTGSRGK
jgi:ABC-type transporter Mla subunit MlaD